MPSMKVLRLLNNMMIIIRQNGRPQQKVSTAWQPIRHSRLGA